MKNSPDVGGMNRLKYCDHTAAFDSYGRDFDCQGAGGAEEDSGGGGGFDTTGGGGNSKLGHHHATGAHQCWLGGGQQLKCSLDKTAGREIVAGKPMGEFFASPWNRGGIENCSAQLNVFNWIIPKSISSGGGFLWSKHQLTNKTQFGKAGGGDNQGSTEWNENYTIGQAHKDGESVHGDTGSWLMSKEELSMMVDPWALTHVKAVYPLTKVVELQIGNVRNKLPLYPGKFVGVDDPYPPLLARTGFYFNKYAEKPLNEAHEWHKTMTSFLSPRSQEDGVGDHLHSVPVMWKPEKRRTGYKGGYASGYQDPRQQSANRADEFPEAWGPRP
jgi:hypothetical protein